MADDFVHPSTIAAIRGVMEVGGPKELEALNKELNGLSPIQLEGLQKFIPFINQAEKQVNGIPPLQIEGGGWGRPGFESHEFAIEQETKDGKTKEIYRREFEDDHGIKTDVKFGADGKMASRDIVTAPGRVPVHIVLDSTDQK
jgi:hypothetical protein